MADPLRDGTCRAPFAGLPSSQAAERCGKRASKPPVAGEAEVHR